MASLVFHSRLKHLEIDFHFVRNPRSKKVIQDRHISTHYHVAEILTTSKVSTLQEQALSLQL